MAISQIETYNAVKMIKEVSTLFPFRCKSYVGYSHPVVFVDKFGNHINSQKEIDSTAVVLTDTIYKVPHFVCTNTLSKEFRRCFDIVRSNSMRLNPKACTICSSFISFVDSHPLPDENDISPKTVIESRWTAQETWETYYKLLDEFYNALKEDMKMFDFVE